MEDKDNILVYSLGHSDPYCAATVSLNLSVSLNQTITRKMDIWDVWVIARAQWFGFEWLWISVYNRAVENSNEVFERIKNPFLASRNDKN